MTETTTTDIGQLASRARTALDDPGAFETWVDMPTVTFSNAIQMEYAIDCLDQILAITDPLDDEREVERCADALDALGRHIARIRDQVAGPDPADDDDPDNVIGLMDRALDTLDEAIAGLRAIAERQEADDLRCEDCDVNGDDCRTHGEAWRLVRRAVMENPERVVELLRD